MPNIAEPVSLSFISVTVGMIFVIIALGIFAVQKGKNTKEK
ncbi:MAG: hypothetical protein RBR54_01175 [Sulfurimonas sp.]|nr:hypothetical protein [Sulfurimonas sp.]